MQCSGTVVKLDRGFPLIRTQDGGEFRCKHATAYVKGGNLRAVIGDRVVVDLPDGADMAQIIDILPRKNQFIRKDPAERAIAQVLAANFDTVIIAHPLSELNIRRLERELVLAHETGARVVVALTKSDLAEDEAHAVVDFCIERNLPAVVVGKKDIQIVNRNDLVNHVFYDMLKIDYDKFDVPVDDVIRQGILQITPFLTEDEERSILPDLPGCTSARWYPAFCDITSAAADKANGIRAIAQYMGLDISETMAFGDGGNDMSMLSAAGVGVAMGNALDKVKAEADYVTTSVDDDGIRNALLHFGVIDN